MKNCKSARQVVRSLIFAASFCSFWGFGATGTGNGLEKSTRKVFSDNAFREVPGEYLRPCDKPGKVLKFTYTTRDNQTPGSADYAKDCMIYLPYGYDADKAKRYDILYLMHGGGGKITDYIGDGASNVPSYKHMLDHMIASGELAPVIVCSLTYNTPYCRDATKNCVDFHHELRKDIIPAVESAFRTCACNVAPAELERTRWHRAFSGFSMGACATWAVFGQMVDCIACYIPTSGDCWTYGRGDFAKTARSLASDLAAKGAGPEDFRVYSGAGRTDVALPNLAPLVDEMRKIDSMFRYCDNFATGNLYKMVFEKGGHDFGTILNVAYNGLPKIFDTEPLSPAVDPPAPCGPLPTERQLWWQDLETYAFIHYSLNTYTDQEWGFGNEDPKLFNPERLDARQWARVCRESGMKGAILTAKHHCGFCLWPSKYTDYSVKSSPWKGGKGDVVREFADACRAEGIKFAVYLSPWDRNHPEYGRPAYVEYFRNQLKELLTEYGDVFEVWFDGANGGNGWYGGANETRRIDKSYYGWEETFKMIRKLQPDALIWNDGGARGDLRWIGNEAGCCGERNWSLLNATGDVSGGELNSGREDGDSWVPGETNTSIRPGWFHHYAEDGHVKSLSKLMDIYYKSVGRNSTLLLNFPISPDGLIPEEDAKRGAAFAKAVKEVFKEDLAKGAKATADNVRGKCAAYSASNAVDGNPETYWATDDGVTRAALTVDFGKPTTFNRVVACEYIRLGQRVRRFSMEAFVDGEWREIRDALGGHDAQTTVGRKRILCVSATTATKLRFTVLDAKACPLISTLGVYNAPELTADIPDSGEKRCGMYHVFFAGPRQMNIDLGGVKKICGFRYKPPRDGKNGVVTHYSLSSTVDWAKWEKLASGEFSNVVNNPIWQTVKFKPVDAGIVSFTADCLAEGDRLRYDDFELLFEK